MRQLAGEKEIEIAMFEAIKDDTENVALISNLDAPDAYSRFQSVAPPLYRILIIKQ